MMKYDPFVCDYFTHTGTHRARDTHSRTRHARAHTLSRTRARTPVHTGTHPRTRTHAHHLFVF